MHKPVLLEETIKYLITDLHGIYIDCTVGGGGHLKKLLQVIADDAKVIGLDKDQWVLEETSKTVAHPGLTLIHADFRNLQTILMQLGITEVHGIILDLGVSSFQLDDKNRGFSYHSDADLDMRMDKSQVGTAQDIVNLYTEEELRDLISRYGEERYSRTIARAIVRYRQKKRIQTTGELADIIKSSVPAKYRRDKHPARKTFQALRIEVNDELAALIEVLPQAVGLLRPGGRLCIITFHSLEDRIVKKFLLQQARECICSPGTPVCTCAHKAKLKIITKKPVIPTEQECAENHRARSAKLRVASRI
ncbi:MAG: 16S rRNA (cytosine(1402)-N(4))-methyltransferase RsmH [Syntrophomonadaceae bacterium]|jgi:16S rRNA (cytosine1402-N4)-methyltransferase